MAAGYLKASTARLFYWFVQAEQAAGSAPLVVWFNGGPGCSSLSGFFTENGPFTTDGNTLSLRPYRWSQFSHNLYFENPVG